jgi:hypothetical protein
MAAPRHQQRQAEQRVLRLRLKGCGPTNGVSITT